MADDAEEKLPTSEELPTSADEEPEDFLAYVNRKLNASSAERAAHNASIGLKARKWDLEGRDLEKRKVEALERLLESERDNLNTDPEKLSFGKEDLDRYVEQRKTGLRAKSVDWLNRAAQALWDCTHGDISYETMTALRTFALEKYKSVDSHSKVLSFARAYLSHLSKTRQDTRYQAFSTYLDLPKALRERKAVTSRIVTKDDINNVLRHIKKAEQDGHLTSEKSVQYSAFIVFGAFSGQRSESTMSRLKVRQFRHVIASEKPVLQVESSQDKIKMAHYVPIHPQAVTFLQPLIEGREDDEPMFDYQSFLMWIKREKIPMSRFEGHFVLGDLRKFAEQYGDIIQWEQSNRSYILTHGVSGVDWAHYRHPLPENVFNVYMKYWKDVDLIN